MRGEHLELNPARPVHPAPDKEHAMRGSTWT